MSDNSSLGARATSNILLVYSVFYFFYLQEDLARRHLEGLVGAQPLLDHHPSPRHGQLSAGNDPPA